MKSGALFGTFALCAAALMLGAESAGAGKNPAKKLEDIGLITELQKTAHLLSKADRDYKGHRAAAVKQIRLAIGDLKKEAKVRGFKVSDTFKGPEPQPVSDEQLKKARKDLRTILKQINNLPATKRRTLAAEHVQKAIDELGTALMIA
jgi:hypothetical protein